MNVAFMNLAMSKNSQFSELKLNFLKNCLFFSLRHTTHVQISHAVTGAVRRIPVLMEGHALSCGATPNKSSTAHA